MTMGNIKRTANLSPGIAIKTLVATSPLTIKARIEIGGAATP
jgi:hypothetical protein